MTAVISTICAVRAEHEHDLRIAPHRRARIGVRKAGVKADIADGDRQPGQLEREVRERKAERQQRAHVADDDPVDQEEAPGGFDFVRHVEVAACMAATWPRRAVKSRANRAWLKWVLKRDHR